MERRYHGMNSAQKVGIGSEIIELVSNFESKSETSEILMVKSLKRIFGFSDNRQVISKLFERQN